MSLSKLTTAAARLGSQRQTKVASATCPGSKSPRPHPSRFKGPQRLKRSFHPRCVTTNGPTARRGLGTIRHKAEKGRENALSRGVDKATWPIHKIVSGLVDASPQIRSTKQREVAFPFAKVSPRKGIIYLMRLSDVYLGDGETPCYPVPLANRTELLRIRTPSPFISKTPSSTSARTRDQSTRSPQ